MNMDKLKMFGIILLSLSLLGLPTFVLMSGITASIDPKMVPSANSDPSGTQTIETQVMTESQATRLKFSGEVLTCTDLTDFKQAIEFRVSNLNEDNISISIDYPISRTIELMPDQIMSIYLSLPYRVASINLSSNEEKLILQMPLCNSGDSSRSISQSSFSRPPSPAPELSTIALTGIGVFGLIFVISRIKE